MLVQSCCTSLSLISSLLPGTQVVLGDIPCGGSRLSMARLDPELHFTLTLLVTPNFLPRLIKQSAVLTSSNRACTNLAPCLHTIPNPNKHEIQIPCRSPHCTRTAVDLSNGPHSVSATAKGRRVLIKQRLGGRCQGNSEHGAVSEQGHLMHRLRSQCAEVQKPYSAFGDTRTWMLETQMCPSLTELNHPTLHQPRLPGLQHIPS